METDPSIIRTFSGHTDRVRAVIAATSAIVRQGLRVYAARVPMEIVAEITSHGQCFELVRDLAPDVVLLEAHFAESRRYAALRAFRRACPTTVVIVVNVCERRERVLEAVFHGAAGYISLESSVDDLQATLASAAQGRLLVSDGVLREAVIGLDTSRASWTSANVTVALPLRQRETEVLRMMAEGRSDSEIAEELAVSVKTVREYVSKTLRRLHVSSRVQAVLWALGHGVAEIPPSPGTTEPPEDAEAP